MDIMYVGAVSEGTDLLFSTLRSRGHAISVHPTVAEASAALDQEAVALVLLEPTGAEEAATCCAALRAHARTPAPLLVVIGDEADPEASALLEAGADDLLPRSDATRIAHRLALIERRIERTYGPSGPEAQRSLSWLRALLDEARDAVFISDAEGRFVDVNRAACTLTGYDRAELLRLHIPDLHDEANLDAYHRFHQRILDGEELVSEARVLRKDGTSVDVEFNNRRLDMGDARFMHTIARDVTARRRADEERHRLEARVQHVQKLESLGILAGGIAHDFNNLLVSILGNAGLAMLDVPDGSPARATLGEIERAALRASELTKQMLAYSGKGHFLLEALNVSHVVRQVETLLRASLPPDARLVLRLADDLPAVRADATQLDQVLMSLVSNAIDALPTASGEITIATSVVRADRRMLGTTYLDDNLPEGDYISLVVADTGCGMDAATLPRVFDPFFSTKFPGRGLGLAAVLGIVRGHKGAIRIDSTPGAGTTVLVLIPALADPPARPASARDEASAGPRRLVLVVDDDEGVARVAARMIERVGYETRVVTSGEDAIRFFEAHGSQVAAVVLDLFMPGLDGVEALDRLREIRPTVAVLLSSGYEVPDTRRLSRPGVGFIQKPYLAEDLVGRIARAIRDASATSDPSSGAGA